MRGSRRRGGAAFVSGCQWPGAAALCVSSYAMSRICYPHVVCLAALLLLSSGCRTSKNTPTASLSPAAFSASPPHVVIIAPDLTVTPEHRHVIADEGVVRELFSSLSTPPTQPFKHYLLVAPYSVVFADAKGEICAAFRYSVCSKPPDMFWPCMAQRRGESYVLSAGVPKMGVAVPGFSDRFRAALELSKLGER